MAEKPHLLIWGGPVASSNMKAQLPPPLQLVTVNQGVGGIGSNAFRDLALSMVDSDGHILPTLLARMDWTLDDFADVSLSGFSAFHGFANEVLLRDADLVTACVCLDACFSSFEHPAKAGYVKFGEKAARGEKLFVLSGSLGGGQTFTTGVECVIKNVEASAEQAGLALRDVPVPDGVPQPSRAIGVGGLVGLDYQGAYTHVGHVHNLSTPLLQGYLAPWLESRTLPPGNESASSSKKSRTGLVVGFLGALALTGALIVSSKSSASESQEKGRE